MEIVVINNGQVDFVPETQKGPEAPKPIQDPSPSNAKHVGMQKPKLCQNQRVRNARGSKNPQTGRKKDIKTMVKQNFKRSSASGSKVINICEEGSSKGKQEIDKKTKKSEEVMILGRMRQMQLQQNDTAQVCMGC